MAAPTQSGNRTVIGIDPGVNGGISAWRNGVLTNIKMPATVYDIRDHLWSIIGDAAFDDHPITMFIEKIPFFVPGQGNQGSGTAKLHANHGVIKGMAIAWGIMLDEPPPQKWQKTFGVGTKSACSGTTEWKNKLKSEAQRLYPNIKVIHAFADSLLILTYGLRSLKLA